MERYTKIKYECVLYKYSQTMKFEKGRKEGTKRERGGGQELRKWLTCYNGYSMPVEVR